MKENKYLKVSIKVDDNSSMLLGFIEIDSEFNENLAIWKDGKTQAVNYLKENGKDNIAIVFSPVEASDFYAEYLNKDIVRRIKVPSDLLIGVKHYCDKQKAKENNIKL